jgi:hypothetical protein
MDIFTALNIIQKACDERQRLLNERKQYVRLKWLVVGIVVAFLTGYGVATWQ